MSSQTLPLSQETLAQFNHDQAADGPQRLRRASVSTRRCSRDNSKNHLPSRPPPPLLRRLSDASHLSRATSYPASPFPRRDSVFFSKRFSVGAWTHGGRVSFSGLLLPQPAHEVSLENSYRMGPDPGNTFSTSRTQQILQATLDSYLDGARYNSNTCSQLSLILADLVRGKIKDTCPPRYKLVCQVVIGQNSNQSLAVASRGLLDSSRDDFAAATFQNNSLFTVAVVYGSYYE
ncbi:dynein light chain Tctex-type 5-A [Clupea harengus]|uniref:Dynein light chain Tctex-type 5-A n=1 Tax=Clupea harengus TaxID=7950 RepID=A0A6P3VTT1_CLUHA|nr:dynein light chain Tctex-type 5-A [Clupea harengus]